MKSNKLSPNFQTVFSSSPDTIYEKIRYQDVISLESLKAALHRTKSPLFPGLDRVGKANYTDEKIKSLHKELESQKYKPRPTKTIYIQAYDGSTRPLGISSQKDKIVQASLLNSLEPLLEKVFLDCSYGFRPNKNCHNALKSIKSKWQPITWFIKIDVSNYFDTIHHPILFRMLDKYCDQATCELISKLLKVGYGNMYNLADSVKPISQGASQGSLISPILKNLYLHALDSYVSSTLLPEWNRGDENRFFSENTKAESLTPEEKQLIQKVNLPGLNQAIISLKYNQWLLEGNLSTKLTHGLFRRLRYVRYADDFLLGFTGPKNEASLIKQNIELYLTETLKVKPNEEKSQIFHSSDRGVKFLDFYLKSTFPNKIGKDSQNETQKGILHLKSIAFNQIQLRIPVEDLLMRAVEQGYAKKRSDGKSYRATSCRKLASFPDKDIVIRVSSLIRAILQYYSPANQYSDLWGVISLYRKSCALTLADKHKLKTAAAVFKKYGPKLKIHDPLNSNKYIELYYPESLKTTTNFRIGKPHINPYLLANYEEEGREIQYIKTNNICQYSACSETSGLEQHHLNPIKNIKKKDLTPFELSLQKK